MDLKNTLINLKPKSETINLKDGTTLTVRMMLAGEYELFEASLYKLVGDKVVMNVKTARTKLIMLTLCDEEGQRVFNDSDIEMVKMIPQDLADQIFQIASRLNGLEVDSKN